MVYLTEKDPLQELFREVESQFDEQIQKSKKTAVDAKRFVIEPHWYSFDRPPQNRPSVFVISRLDRITFSTRVQMDVRQIIFRFLFISSLTKRLPAEWT